MSERVEVSLPAEVWRDVQAELAVAERDYAMQAVDERYTVRAVNATGRAERLRDAHRAIEAALVLESVR